MNFGMGYKEKAVIIPLALCAILIFGFGIYNTNEVPTKEILIGLKFARNRWHAKDSGILKVGRKSIIQKEIHSVTSEQAIWRLKNWKMMIANYRRRGYSYPTISRIKKILVQISKKKSK